MNDAKNRVMNSLNNPDLLSGANLHDISQNFGLDIEGSDSRGPDFKSESNDGIGKSVCIFFEIKLQYNVCKTTL